MRFLLTSPAFNFANPRCDPSSPRHQTHYANLLSTLYSLATHNFFQFHGRASWLLAWEHAILLPATLFAQLHRRTPLSFPEVQARCQGT